jgi:hypothetical protein
LIRTTPETDALLVLKSGRVLATPGFPVFNEDAEASTEEDHRG